MPQNHNSSLHLVLIAILSIILSACQKGYYVENSDFNSLDRDNLNQPIVATGERGYYAAIPIPVFWCDQKLVKLSIYGGQNAQSAAEDNKVVKDLILASVKTFKKVCPPAHMPRSLSVNVYPKGTPVGGRPIYGFQSRANDGWLTGHEFSELLNQHWQAEKARKQAAKERKKQQYEAQVREIHRTNYAPEFVVDGPFNGITAANYLNAIYHGKISTVRQANRDYSNSQKRLYALFMGRGDRVINLAYDNILVHDTVAAYYLFGYERLYKGCLRNDAIQFHVEEHVPDVVTHNLLGVEMWRVAGYSSRYDYKVNPEFAPVFKKVGAMNPEAMGVTNMFIGMNLKDFRKEAGKGIRQIQRKFPCNSPVIKQFERNLLRLY